MKHTIIAIATLLLTSSPVFSGEQDVHLSYEQYIDYSLVSEDLPLRLQVVNEIIREVGSIERTIELAEKGYDKPSFAIGSLHLYGHVFEKNEKKGIDLLLKGSKNGPYSKFELGMHLIDIQNKHDHDLVTKRDGAQFIYEAAQYGLEEAQYIAAKLLIEGEHIVEDRDMAMIFLNSAASKTYLPAIKQLQAIRDLHTEFREDFDKIQRRASEGHLPSVIRLAQLYHHGWRVTTDKLKAKRLLEYADAKGSEQAAMLLSTLSFK